MSVRKALSEDRSQGPTPIPISAVQMAIWAIIFATIGVGLGVRSGIRWSIVGGAAGALVGLIGGFFIRFHSSRPHRDRIEPRKKPDGNGMESERS